MHLTIYNVTICIISKAENAISVELRDIYNVTICIISKAGK